MTGINMAPSTWYKRAARLGLIAKGFVYCLSGSLALMAALHLGNTTSEKAGKKGVFAFIEEQPFGKILLLLTGIGLVCYTVWRWIQAFKDTEHKGAGIKGWSKRFNYFFSGLMYAGLAVYTVKSFFSAGDSGGDAKEGWARKLLSQPYGQWLVGIVALIMIGMGGYQIYRALSGKYRKYVKEALQKDTAPWVTAVGVAGYTARGLVWLIIGWLFIKAALHANPREAGGSDDAFSWMEQSYGSILLAAIAVGLICYGLFMFLRAAYQPLRYR